MEYLHSPYPPKLVSSSTPGVKLFQDSRNIVRSVKEKWVELKIIILSKINHTENKYGMFSLYTDI